MKTEQEQIEAIYNLIISHLFEDTVYSLAEQIYEAGYGEVSEYKAEIERLKAETSNIRRETAKEILDMLYDIGIDKETLECCRIFDVNGVSLAKQICEKYGVEIEK